MPGQISIIRAYGKLTKLAERKPMSKMDTNGSADTLPLAKSAPIVLLSPLRAGSQLVVCPHPASNHDAGPIADAGKSIKKAQANLKTAFWIIHLDGLTPSLPLNPHLNP
jgi:hypothetical protein